MPRAGVPSGVSCAASCPSSPCFRWPSRQRRAGQRAWDARIAFLLAADDERRKDFAAAERRLRAAEAGALVQIALALQWAEDFPPAFERVREAIEIAESVGAQAPLGFGLYIRGYMHALNGRLDDGEASTESAISSARITAWAGPGTTSPMA